MNANWTHVTLGALTVAAFISCVALLATGHVSALLILALTAAIEAALLWLRRMNRPITPKREVRSVPFMEPTTVAGH